MVVDSAKVHGGRSRGAPRLTALEHVANRPIVHHVLDGFRRANVEDLIIAGEPDALIDIRSCVQDYERHFRGVEYALCRDGVDLRSTLNAVAPFVRDAPCLIHPADGLLDSPVRSADGVLDPGLADVVIFVAPDAVERAGDSGRPLRAVGAAGRADTDPHADIALFGPGMLDRARATVGAREDGLVGTGERMAAAGADVRVQRVDGWRRYRGDGLDLLELNRIALDRLDATPPSSVLCSNRVEGRVEVDPTATVRDSVIIGPAVIGPGAFVNQAYVGPYTSIGAGARIEGTEIERSIVAADACVMHVGGRLVSSLVGREARIFRDFSLPRGLRLWVGDGDEIALC
jgi:glucose-1-phosphate thymidylyltransferase